MSVEQRRQRPKIFGRKPLPQPLALNRTFNEERVNQHEAVLEELQRQGDHFLLFSAIRGQFALTTITDEVIGRVPVLNDVESLVDLPLNLSRSKVIAEKDRLFSLPNFGKRFVRRMRHVVGVVPLENGFGLRSASNLFTTAPFAFRSASGEK